MESNKSRALKEAIRKFGMRSPLERSLKSGFKFIDGKGIMARFLNEDYLVDVDGEVSQLRQGTRDFKIEIKMLLLHYLSTSKDIPLAGVLVPFRDLPGAVSYEKAFFDRAVKPIADAFSNDLSGFRSSAMQLDASETNHGDMAFSIPVLPRIPLIYVLWQGDDEISGYANILFDSTAKEHLPTEDLAVLSELTTEHLIASLGNLW